ncbi:hypothetical protein [Candidatus Williamhamiltonella defendens]|uniref:Uncharacterized protein n=1 Tax=Candidatus Williamhamiltonella defendens TaxID=138072 RepID=A0A2D3TGD6_9ENTR|nr:hypothetical protein [Candidatus Hamiltonella defensa]ATW34869.1 hypothetical protein BJP43_10885 [Candidatus Hamiltonella defensa]
MSREKKFLLALIVFAIIGLLAVAVLATTLVNFKVRMISAEDNAFTWKRQAGKAYTELLKARAGTDHTETLIPVGSRIDCAMKADTFDYPAIAKCEDGVVYPPREY